MISELKLNDCLKVDGRKVDVLLLGLRNDYYLRKFFDFALSAKRATHGRD